MNELKLKKIIYKIKPLANIIIPIYHGVKKTRNFSSGSYWEKRYKRGGNSGAGSYGRLAQFKADIINKFVKDQSIKTVLEMGSGDGNQLELFNLPHYIGFDISKTSIVHCVKKFADDNKSFFLYDPVCFVDNQSIFNVDMTMSLDVIFHLVEDDIFDKYMHDLFSMAKQYVIIYSSNTEDSSLSQAQHVRHRKFTDWVDINAKKWKLEKRIKNKYEMKEDLIPIDESPADFYIYKKTK